MRSLEVAERADISYRQLDFWLRKGYIKARHGGGSGILRDFSDEEARIVIRAGQLLKIGLKPEHATAYARLMIEEYSDGVEVEGFIISVAPEPGAAAGAEDEQNVSDVSDVDDDLVSSPSNLAEELDDQAVGE